MNTLFTLLIEIGRGENTEMPPGLIGAHVQCFTWAADPETATKQMVSSLTKRGFEFLEVKGQIHQLDPLTWDLYVASVWPDCPGFFPNQSTMLAAAQLDTVFYSPFSSYERRLA
jgi:hypothetical protein